ncbi:MAG TPA: hypothetical protein VHI13_05795 [Candidatus Kapabacteria bacterium]|nr:hypothetical protein [Candidatus Kapabacteria bacterium]
MPFSEDIEHVLNYLDQAAGQGLHKRNDMGTLLELAIEFDRHEEMNELIFHGRVLHNLYGTLRRASAGAEGYAKVEHEFAAAVESVRDRLANLLADAAEEHIQRFEIHYYASTQGSLRNLIDLAHDLGVLKSVQNERKHQAHADPGDDAPSDPDATA